MQKHLLKLALCSLSLLTGAAMQAEIIKVTHTDGTVYSVNTATSTATLDSVPRIESIVDLVVPDNIEYQGKSYNVTAVGYRAGAWNALYLRSVKIGNNVTTIGDEAFKGCVYIESVTLGSAVKEIGNSAFYQLQAVGNVTLPEGLEKIGEYAFYDCRAITQVTVPASVKSIASNPWGACTALTKISVAEGSTTFATNLDVLFDKNITRLISYPCGKRVNEYILPASTREVGDNAVRNSSYLMNVMLNDGLEVIGGNAFNSCNLTSCRIPASVKEIRSRAFTFNRSINQFVVEEGNQYYKAINKYLCTIDGKRLLCGIDNRAEAVIPESVEIIDPYAFYSLYITGVKMTNVRTIGKSAFYSCSQLRSIDFGSKLDSIGDMAFMRCSSLSTLNFPASLRSLGGMQIFTQSFSLQTVNFNEGLQEIGPTCFMLCTALKNVKLPGTINKWGESIFYSCSQLDSLSFGEGITVIPTTVAAYCSSLRSVTLPSTVKVIEQSAFNECRQLTEITLPADLERVGVAAFQFVPLTEIQLPSKLKTIEKSGFAYGNLRKVVCPASLRTLGDWAFGNNKTLSSVTLNQGIDSLGMGVFMNCEGITKFEIPSSVTTIGSGLLVNIPYISEIINNATTPQALTQDIVNDDRYGMCKLVVPDGCLDAYKNSPVWKKFSHIETMGVNGISDDNAAIVAIYGLDGIRRASLQNGINIVRLSNGKTRKIVVAE